MHDVPEWLLPFSPAFGRALASRLDGATGRLLACFDADGTLWNEDLGEAFFRWLAAGGLLPALDPRRDAFEVYAEYEERVKVSRAAGFTWAVRCMAGLLEVDVRRWSRQMAVAWPNYRAAMAGLAAGLAAAGHDVWIVTASNRWVIEAAAPLAGFDPAHVLGIGLDVIEGRLTDRVIEPVTCNAGKVDAIRGRLGRAPDIAVGDSLGDLEMLESAALPLVVGRSDRPGGEIARLAEERGWPIHLF